MAFFTTESTGDKYTIQLIKFIVSKRYTMVDFEIRSRHHHWNKNKSA